MPDISTKYMGLNLKNPLVVSSSSLTQKLEGVKKCADAGAGAVVLKSLFEEQIEAETKVIEDGSDMLVHPEAIDYVRQMGMRIGPNEYIDLIEGAKKEVDIPIIASLNCITDRWWLDYAKEIERAGADAVELNIAIMPRSRGVTPGDIEKRYIRIVHNIRSSIELPIAVKIGPYFTVLPDIAGRLREAGADAIVLFNRFYQLDIDIENLKLKPGYRFSNPQEIYTPLRWMALLYDKVGCDLAASTGVHDGAGVIKMILAGADAVQVCSTLYLNGLEQISVMLEELGRWMDKRGFSSLSDFRGAMSKAESSQPEYYERLQYIKALVGIE